MRSFSVDPLLTGTGNNPKAFAFARPGKLQKQAVRSHEVGYEELEGKMLSFPGQGEEITCAVGRSTARGSSAVDCGSRWTAWCKWLLDIQLLRLQL